jgi:hypothetical protein
MVLDAGGRSSMPRDHKCSYNAEIIYRKGTTLSFDDFEITYDDLKERKFEMAGVVRSNFKQIFLIAFTNDSGELEKITREYSYGFPGGHSEGIGFAVRRRKYFSITIWNAFDEGGYLKISPSAVSYEPKGEKGELVIRKTAELGLEVEIDGNTVLAYPDFDLSIRTITKHWVILSEDEKKAAVDKAYAYYTENHIAVPDDYLKPLEGPDPTRTLHITIGFRLTKGEDNVTGEICWPQIGEVEYKRKKYSIELTSIPTFRPETDTIINQKIVVRKNISQR